MRRLMFLMSLFVLTAGTESFAQGVLIPENGRIAPFPRPVPGPHPLKVKSLKVETRIQGQVATTRVSQVFSSDLDFVIEGIYFYPLPEDATFVDFATWDGDRKLRGEVLEKEEARNRYLSIVRRCWDPGLLEYAGLNLFQARVFPVPARGEKRLEFSYSQTLKADHGLVSYVYPLQVGARANPQPIGTATITAEIVADQGLKTIYSPTHTIDTRRDGERRARVSFEGGNILPDRNFQLFYSLSNAELGVSVVTYREGSEDGYFMLLLSPSVSVDSDQVLPKDLIFVLDTSGSMQDRGKIGKARSALQFGVHSLNAGDRFNIITFSSDVRKFREGLVAASEENRQAADRFIERQVASGGTNIYEALKEGVGSFQTGERPRYLVFLTDGLPTVGETDPGKILRDISDTNGKRVRIFTFGVGYDVNTFLLDQLAARNSGAQDYVTPEEDLEVKLSGFFAKLASPVMSGLELDLSAAHTSDVYPRSLPDLFRGSQILMLGRYATTGEFPIALRGNVQGRQRTLRFERIHFAATNSENDFLPRLWAMRKVGYLLEQIRMSGENTELKNEIIQLAKKYSFVTPYTSFLAADEKDYLSGMPRPIPLSNLQMTMPAAAPGNGATAGRVAQEAVAASIGLKQMKFADQVMLTATKNERTIGNKTFANKNGVWTDASYDPKLTLPVVDFKFGSEELLKAISMDRQLASYASLGSDLIVVHRGKVYRIRP